MTVDGLTLQYGYHSRLDSSGLLLAASNQRVPVYFQGSFCHPRRSADFLLALCSVVGRRFYTPPQMVAKLVRESDPVITCGKDRIRWEAFSTCCSVYVRIDQRPEALNGALLAPGTTNVDLGPESRAALSQVASKSQCQLSIASSGLEISGSQSLQEKRVRLPKRWLQSFVEAQYHQHSMQHFAQLSLSQWRRFLASLPTASRRGKIHIHKTKSGLRVSHRSGPSKKAILLEGWERLKCLESLLIHTRSLDIYSNASGATAWLLHGDDANFTLLLSPSPQRGFSGEGQALLDLFSPPDPSLETQISEHLADGGDSDLKEFIVHLRRPAAEIVKSIARLSTHAKVGVDLASMSYFERNWDLDLESIQMEHPRIRGAQGLLDAIRWEDGQAFVKSSDAEYRVTWESETPICNCPWYQKYRMSRGACKHILATQWSLHES